MKRIEQRKMVVCALSALLGLVPVADGGAEARSCGQRPPIEQEFEVSTVVFIGTVMTTEVQEDQTVATFSVERIWKGVVGPTIRVATPGGRAVIFSTSLTFEPGERYVVFATGAFPRSINCNRTGTESHHLWSETIEWLDRQPSKRAG